MADLFPELIISDFLDPNTVGVFTTQYSEPDELLLLHNKSGIKVKLIRSSHHLTAYMFSFTNGWLEVLRERVSGPVTFFPMMLPKANEKDEASKRDATVEEFRKYNGLRFLKNLAIILGENPEDLDAVALE